MDILGYDSSRSSDSQTAEPLADILEDVWQKVDKENFYYRGILMI